MATTTVPDSVLSTLVLAPATADALQALHLQRLSYFTTAQHAALAVEQKRLAAKYGAGSPQANAATVRLDLLDRQRAAIATRLAHQAIPTPETSSTAFIVFGRVVSSSRKILPGAKLVAIDPNGKHLAETTANKCAEFELKVPLSRDSKTVVKVAERDTSSELNAVQFEIQVTAAEARRPYTWDETFVAAPDRLANREIVVPDANVSSECA